MRIAILDDYSDTLRTLPCFTKLAGHDVTVFTDHVQDAGALAERLRDIEALVLIRERTRIEAALLERLPGLRLISQFGGYPHIDVAACTRHGVVVSSELSGGGTSHGTAELTWGLLIAAARRIPQQMASLRAGGWQESVGTTLHGKTLGILGYGRIGTAVAGYATAFGLRVVVWSGEESRRRAAADGHAVAESQRALFAGSDAVSLHVKLTDATRGIVTAADLAAMAPSAILVNTSRAGLIEPGALPAALRAGRPGVAAVDVFDAEPLHDPQDPLLSLDNVVATPHIGYVTREDYERQFASAFEQIVAFAGGEPINVVNPEVLAMRQ
ncbi:D-2-hydroxyacid dehydrogenase family protein [Dactylosporangium sp. CA-092794]|uniref:D-2-hydroxyacid dehydrogenase family protein n=1 Tax=Dactylosporangium sp. CA-092794 TaxID=3239929 RepID=UPI003D940F17